MPLVPLVRQMRHPKLLVRAVLALTVADDSSAFQECAAVALEQCGYQQQPNQPSMTPGLAGRIATQVLSLVKLQEMPSSHISNRSQQDVTHLLWLSYLIRAYRLLEGTEQFADEGEDRAPIEEALPSFSVQQSALSCRQFLRCFTVHGASETRLSRDLSPDAHLDLARFVFGALSLRRISSALRAARLASADAEALLGDCVLVAVPPAAQRLEQLVRTLLVRAKRVAEPDASVALPVLLARVQATPHLGAALAMARLVQWPDVVPKLEALLKLPARLQLCINDAARGSFSLYQLLAQLGCSGLSAEAENVASNFPQHAAQTALIAAHACLIRCHTDRVAATLGVEDVVAAEEEPVDEDEIDDQSAFLDDALQALLQVQAESQLQAAVALWAWQHRLAPLFWRCCSLVDVAGKTPRARTAQRALGLSLSEMRQLASVARDWLGLVLAAWSSTAGVPGWPVVPFPSQVDQAVQAARDEWAQRPAALLVELQQTLLVARALLAVFRYQLRGVHILCVVPLDSALRELLQDGDLRARSGNPDFQRKELVLRLMPLNATLAAQFAKVSPSYVVGVVGLLLSLLGCRSLASA
jgi:hypothetical protein